MEEFIKVGKDTHNHLIFRHFDVWVVAMCAIVDDAVHIEVEVVNDGDNGSPARLIDERVALAKPAVKFRDTWTEKGCKQSVR